VHGRRKFLSEPFLTEGPHCLRKSWHTLNKTPHNFLHSNPPIELGFAQTSPKAQVIMPAPVNTLLIDGSFEELSEELAQYFDDIKKKNGDESANLKGDILPLLEQNQQDEVLKKLVTGSNVLNAAPEKGMSLAIES
jgi:hypothetical protein